MDCGEARLTTPAMLPEVARHLDRNLAQAGLLLQHLKREKTSSKAHGIVTVNFFKDVIKQNDTFTALLKTWLGMGRLQGKAEEAKRLLSVLQDTTLLALEAITTVQAKIPDAPDVHVPDLQIPIEDAADITAGLDLQIDLATSALASFQRAAAIPLPMVSTKELDENIAIKHEELAYVDAIAPQVARWRKQSLTPSQRMQVSDVAARFKKLRKLLTGILECFQRMKRTAFDPEESTLDSVLKGLVQD